MWSYEIPLPKCWYFCAKWQYNTDKIIINGLVWVVKPDKGTGTNAQIIEAELLQMVRTENICIWYRHNIWNNLLSKWAYDRLWNIKAVCQLVLFICSVVEIWWLRWYNIAEDGQGNHFTDKKEDDSMAVLAKPINRITVIKNQESQEFVREFNGNKLTKDFLDSCKKAGKLFGKRK